MKNDFEIVSIENPSLLREKIKAALEGWKHLLPKDRDAKILLKPNFNSNFDALTGNTTDLRLLAMTIEFLQSKGYQNIIIAEGTSSGFYREGISVIRRIGADRLASIYDVEIVDLNVWPHSIEVHLENGVIAHIADLMASSDFVINMPKLKTHFEVGMSVCLKNLIGACIGLTNKKKIHGDLAKNIVHLNRAIKPDLHIVDGLIAMEGTGPSRGTPVNYGKVIIGTNPFKIDYLCGRLCGFANDDIRTLVEARKMGFISVNQVQEWESIPLNGYDREFQRPSVSPLVSFVTNPRFQKHLIKIRYAPVIRTICSTQTVKVFLYATGISHEKILKTEANISLRVDETLCTECCKCEDYCPIGLKLPEIKKGGGTNCIECLYCFFVCPTQAIKIDGNPGFYSEQIRVYGDLIRKIA